MDRLYTSIPIARWLLSKNITCVGTLQTNRVGIPEEVKSVKNREPYSCGIYWEKEQAEFVIVSYHAHVTKGQKNVLVLSIVEQLEDVTKNDGKKAIRI